MKSSQSNFNLRSPGSCLTHSYLIATVKVASFFFCGFLCLQQERNMQPFEKSLLLTKEKQYQTNE